MQRQPEYVMSVSKHTLKRNQRNLHSLLSPRSSLMSSPGTMKLTWVKWNKKSGPSQWKVFCGVPPNLYLSVTESKNCRSWALLKMTKYQLTFWLNRSRSLKTLFNLLTLLLSTKSKLCGHLINCKLVNKIAFSTSFPFIQSSFCIGAFNKWGKSIPSVLFGQYSRRNQNRQHNLKRSYYYLYF